MDSHDKLLRHYEQCQKRLAKTIEDLEEDLERMRENEKISQTLCNKRDAQIESMVDFNNASDDVVKAFNKQRDRIFELGKVPPQALDLEVTVIGAILLERQAIQSVISFLTAEDFYSPAHQYIYRAVLDLHEAGNPIDMQTVVIQLRKRGWLELIGGAYAIAEITEKVNSTANTEYHARCLVEFSIKRKLILLAGEISAKAYDDTVDVFELMDLVNDEIKNIEQPLKLQSKNQPKRVETNGKDLQKEKTS